MWSLSSGVIFSFLIFICLWASHYGGFSVVEHGLSLLCDMWDLPRRGLNLCPLHWQVGSLPLAHLGSPYSAFVKKHFKLWLYIYNIIKLAVLTIFKCTVQLY